MKIGIWTENKSPENMKRLYNMGFRGTTLDPRGEGNQADYMKEFYHMAKQIGFTHFLAQMKSKNSVFHNEVIERFKDCQDVEYLFGEPYSYVESNDWNVEQCKTTLKMLEIKIYAETKKTLIIDLQLRLWDKLKPFLKVPSSYFWQQRVWYKGQPFAWIYGQLAWHSFIPFIGSSSYKRLKREMDKKGITTAYLYQGDTGKFTNLLNNYFQKRFINTMGEK